MNKEKSNERMRKTIIIALNLAIIFVLQATPLGLIRLSPVVSGTTLHIPVIILSILEGPVVGLILGIAFGLMTIIQAIIAPSGFLDPFFVNPLVSVLPRALIAITTYYSYVFIKKMFKNKKSDTTNSLAIIISSLIGSFTNTIFVMLALYFVYAKDILNIIVNDFGGSTFGAFLLGIIATSGLLEAIASAVVSLFVVNALEKSYYKNLKKNA